MITTQIHGGGGSLYSNSTPSSLAALAAAAMATRLPLAAPSFSLVLYCFALYSA
jgi:hypothetical protein